MYLICLCRLIWLKLPILSVFYLIGIYHFEPQSLDLCYEIIYVNTVSIFFHFFLAASQITIENTQGIISNTTSLVTEGVGNTFQNAGISILSHVSETKQGLHNALENFDSQKLFNNGRVCEKMSCDESPKDCLSLQIQGFPGQCGFNQCSPWYSARACLL